MVPELSYRDCQAAELRRRDLVQAVVRDRYLAAHVLAAEERHQRLMADAAQAHAIAEAGLGRSAAPRFATIRRAIGAALIGAGQRLRGAGDPGGGLTAS